MARSGWTASGMTMRLLVSLALAACLLLAQEEPVLRVQVNLVRLLVTAKDAAGNVVTDLTPEDFRIKDNGVQQKVAVFERQTAQTLSVSLLIDNSASTARNLKFEADSVSRFVKALLEGGNDKDRAALYSFNYQVIKHTGFTRQQSSIDQALRRLKGEAGTALYDAMYLASNEFYGREGRHVMVIVTDGGDTTSSKDFQAAVEAAQRADVVIFPVLIVPIENEAGHNVGGENALTTIAENTGGRVFIPTLGASLDHAFEEIVHELRTQYMVAYYPREVPASRDRFHRVTVQMSRPGLRISTRSGYYGESEPGQPGSARIFVAPGTRF